MPKCIHVGGFCVRGTDTEAYAQCGALLAGDKLRGGKPVPQSGWYSFTICGSKVKARPLSRCNVVRTVQPWGF